MAISTTPWDSAEHLKTEEDMQLYLEACLEEAGDDPTLIIHALGVICPRPEYESAISSYRYK